MGRNIYICAFDSGRTLSYLNDWAETFEKYGFRVFNSSAAQRRDVLHLCASIQRCEVVVLGYSCYTGLQGRRKAMLARACRMSRATIVGFMQNEFRDFADKVRTLEEFGVDILVSQLPTETAQEFYCGRAKAKVISIYHGMYTGVIPDRLSYVERPVDIGSRVHEYGVYLGNNARGSVIPTLLEQARVSGRFIVDWDTGVSKRFGREQWLAFLGRCRLTVASEAGSRYIQWSERKRLKINRLVKDLPVDEARAVANQVLAEDDSHMNGLTVSPRLFDAVNAGTCQVLVEGKYNGIFFPDQHFIELKADLSNLHEVLEKMSDIEFCQSITRCAYDHVLSAHTLDHRVNELFASI